MIAKSKKFREVKPGDEFQEETVTCHPRIVDAAASAALHGICQEAKAVYGDQLWIASVTVTIKASIGVITSEGEYALAGGGEEES